MSTDNARRITEPCRLDVSSGADETLAPCLSRSLAMEVIRTFTEKELERIVSMDAGFADGDRVTTYAIRHVETKEVGSVKTA